MLFHSFYMLFKYAKSYGHNVIKTLGLSDTEYMICSFLKGHQNVSQEDLVQILSLDKGTIARAVSNLENKKYLIRLQNKENKRKNILSLTSEGDENVSRIPYIYDEWMCKVVQELSEGERKEFDRIFARILNAAEHLNDSNRGE